MKTDTEVRKKAREKRRRKKTRRSGFGFSYR
jgi:hypothetical protein